MFVSTTVYIRLDVITNKYDEYCRVYSLMYRRFILDTFVCRIRVDGDERNIVCVLFELFICNKSVLKTCQI